MKDPRGAAWLPAALVAAAVVAAAVLAGADHALAGEAGEAGDLLEEEILSPREREALEEKRKREADPVLAVEPTELEETLKQGEKRKLSLRVLNAGGRTLEWSVPEAALERLGWLALSERSGKLGYAEKREITVTLDATRLEPGLKDDKLTVEAAGAEGSPFAVSILLDVQPGEKKEPPKEEPREEEPREEEPRGDGKLPPIGAAPADDKPRAFGVRGSLIMPGGGSRGDYSTAPLIGVLWRPGAGKGRLGYEFSFGIGRTEADSGLESSSMRTGGAHALWRFAGNGSQSFYALGGLSLVSESAEDDELGTTSNFGSMLNVGAGATFAGRYDAQLAYAILMGSENVNGMLSAAFGVMF